MVPLVKRIQEWTKDHFGISLL